MKHLFYIAYLKLADECVIVCFKTTHWNPLDTPPQMLAVPDKSCIFCSTDRVRFAQSELADTRERLQEALHRGRARLTAEEEGAIRTAHEDAIDRERHSAALAVRETKTLAERSQQAASTRALDERLMGRVEAARQVERDACQARMASMQVRCPASRQVCCCCFFVFFFFSRHL